ncbi:MAG: SLAP domain-containing protein [Clostridium sp.]
MDKKTKTQSESIKFDLQLTEGEELLTSDLQKQIWKEELEALKPLTHGEMSLNGVYIFEEEERYELNVFIRNAFERSIIIQTVPLRILDHNNNVLAQQFVDLTEAGEILSHKAKPFKIYLEKESILDKNICDKDWRIVVTKDIEIIETSQVKEFEDFPEEADLRIREDLKVYLNALPFVKYGDVNVNVFRLSQLSLNDIFVLLVIRNGSGMDVTLGKLPLSIIDENNEVVASGIFDLSHIRISKDKAKVCKFDLENEFILKRDMNIKKCSVKLG